eukprot:scaffold26810_cov64-Phaeocystis_antarctica.AAC.5
MGEASGEATMELLKVCIRETVSTRHPDPIEHIARMLVHPNFLQSLSLPTEEYVREHNLEQRITSRLHYGTACACGFDEAALRAAARRRETCPQ